MNKKILGLVGILILLVVSVYLYRTSNMIAPSSLIPGWQTVVDENWDLAVDVPKSVDFGGKEIHFVDDPSGNAHLKYLVSGDSELDRVSVYIYNASNESDLNNAIKDIIKDTTCRISNGKPYTVGGISGMTSYDFACDNTAGISGGPLVYDKNTRKMFHIEKGHDPKFFYCPGGSCDGGLGLVNIDFKIFNTARFVK